MLLFLLLFVYGSTYPVTYGKCNIHIVARHQTLRVMKLMMTPQTPHQGQGTEKGRRRGMISQICLTKAEGQSSGKGEAKEASWSRDVEDRQKKQGNAKTRWPSLKIIRAAMITVSYLLSMYSCVSPCV